MATMLGYLTTDAACRPALLQRALTERRETRSTPSPSTASARPTTCVFALANGASGVAIDEAVYPALRRGAARGLPRAGARHRARRRGRDQADHRSRSPAPRPTTTRGWRRGRSPTRRWSRPRSTAAIRTGAAWSRRPAARARRSSLDGARGARSAHRAVRERPAVRRARAAGRRLPAGQGHPRSTSTSAPAAARTPRSGPATSPPST